jgi:hypothetical protein
MALEADSEGCYYDKENKSIIGTFNLLEKALRTKNQDALKLLTLCSFFERGSTPVPIAVLTGSPSSMSTDYDRTFGHLSPEIPPDKRIFSGTGACFDRSRHSAALMALRKFCCAKVRFHNDRVHSFAIDNAIIRWYRGRLSPRELEHWAVLFVRPHRSKTYYALLTLVLTG